MSGAEAEAMRPEPAHIAPCHVTWWPTLFTAEAHRVETLASWDELFATFERHNRFAGEKAHPGWSPVEFDPPQRSLENVRRIFAVCFDYDGGTSIEDAEECWAGHFGFLHTTRRHTPEQPRFRAILPLRRSVSAFEYQALWTRLAARTGDVVDPQTKDPSRFWFVPGVREGGDYETRRLDGAPLDPDEILSQPEPRVERVSEVVSAPTYTTSATDIERRAIAYLDKMEPAISGSGGHGATWKAALALAQGFGLDQPTVLRLLTDHYNSRCQPPWSPKELKHKAQQAIEAANRVPRGYLLDDDRRRDDDWQVETDHLVRELRERTASADPPAPLAKVEPDADDWPDPLPIGRDVEPPPFPLEALPPWIRNLVSGTARSVQLYSDMPSVFAIGALSAVTGGRVRVRPWPGWEEGCNLYTCVAMPPASTKSPVHRHVTAPILEVEAEMRAAAAPAIERARTRHAVLEKRLKRAEDQAAKATPLESAAAMRAVDEASDALSRERVPPMPRLVLDDATAEQIKTLLSEHNGRLAILSAESSLLGNVASQRYSKNPNIEAILAGHAGDLILVDRRGREERIDDPRLTVCIAVQPSVLREAFGNQAARDRGLFARFLYAIPRSTVGERDFRGVPETVPDEVLRTWSHGIKQIARAHVDLESPRVLHLSQAARLAFQRYRASIEPRRSVTGDLVSIADWSGKMDGHLLRLAGLLHIAWHEQGEVSETTISRAVQLMDYFEAHAKIAYDAMGEDDDSADARKVLAWIRGRSAEQFSQSELARGFDGRLNAEALKPIVSRLIDYGYLRAREVRGRGRRRTVYVSHPSLRSA